MTVIVKSIMDCAQEQQFALTSGVEGSPVDDRTSILDHDASLGLTPQMSPVRSFGDENIVDYWNTYIEKRKAPMPILLSSSQEIQTPMSLDIKQSMSEDSSKQQRQEALDKAFELITAKGFKQGMDFLIACDILTPSPQRISSFLRIHQTSIDPLILGEYLGEGGVDGADKDFWNLIRFNFARATSFVGMNVEQA